ncbi:hypothetical protein [Flavicella sediminum]|uniref:hypothetical protein n=1 Tax=Flavicella sediminum TaxID=2585141 RepID=UPI0011248638|nr:hypothetical protein [Flavicella sediminum]
MKKDLKNKERHQNELGYIIPDGYFAKSKESILEKVQQETKVKRLAFSTKKIILWSATAAAVVLLSLPILNLDKNRSISDSILNGSQVNVSSTVSQHQAENLLLASLFTEDQDLEAIVDAYMIEE